MFGDACAIPDFPGGGPRVSLDGSGGGGSRVVSRRTIREGSMRYVAPLSLEGTVTELRTGRLDPHAHVDAIVDRIEALDPALLTLLPEPGRRARLHADA